MNVSSQLLEGVQMIYIYSSILCEHASSSGLDPFCLITCLFIGLPSVCIAYIKASPVDLQLFLLDLS